MRRPRLTKIAWGLGLLVLVGSIVGANQLLHGAKDAPPAPAPTREPGRGPGLVCFGTVDVEDGVQSLWPPTFPQPSRAAEVRVKRDGAEVKAGDVLLKLDDTLPRQVLAEAQAGLDQARAKLAQAEEGLVKHAGLVAGQSAKIDAKEAELKVQEDRLAHLKKVSGDDKAYAAEIRSGELGVEALKKGVAAERVVLRGLEAAKPLGLKQEAEGAVKQYEAKVAQAKFALEQCELKAPADGVILRSLATPGMTFGPQSKQPPYWFAAKGALIIRAEVDQEFASRVSEGEAAVIHDANNSSLTWRGVVAKVPDWYLPKRSASALPDPFQLNEPRVLECLVSVELPAGAPKLRLGQRVRVHLGGE